MLNQKWFLANKLYLFLQLMSTRRFQLDFSKVECKEKIFTPHKLRKKLKISSTSPQHNRQPGNMQIRACRDLHVPASFAQGSSLPFATIVGLLPRTSTTCGPAGLAA
jgi:hypothetical protein